MDFSSIAFILLMNHCCVQIEGQLQIPPESKVSELRHNITDYDGSGGLPYRYREKFLNHGVIPDVLFLAPKNILKVKWGWKSIHLGTKMLAAKLRDPPQLSWPTEMGVLYTLIMTGPDFPTREMPMEREWIYWRVGNIPENDIHLGDEIDAYAGPSMGFEPLPRRFVLLVYKQPIKEECIKFEEITSRTVIFHERAHFSTRRFAEKYGFDIYAHAGNFFLVDGIRRLAHALTFKDIKAELGKANVIPDVIDEAPKNDIELRINGTSVDLGDRFNLNPLVKPPERIEWEIQRHGIYTFLVTGPDVPSWDQPYEREYMHWQIVNIPGCNYTQGETIATYQGSELCCNQGIHRMVYTVWKQPKSKPMSFPEERRIDNTTSYLRRGFFNTRRFAKKYNMTLWAANYLIVECCIE